MSESGTNQPNHGPGEVIVMRHIDGYATVVENGLAKKSDFADQSVRMVFVREVYAVLVRHLFIILQCIFLFKYTKSINSWAIQNSWIVWLAMVLLILCIIGFARLRDERLRGINIMLLVIFTLVEGFLLGFASCLMDSNEITMTVGITMAVCLAFTGFTFQKKWDFTFTNGSIICVTVVVLLFGIFKISVPDYYGQTRISCLSAFLFSFYIMLDMLLMLAGNHKYAILPKEYFFAALSFYIDIYEMIIFILVILFGRY